MNIRQRIARNNKVEHTSGREYTGWFTPVEIVSFIDEDGFETSYPKHVERARRDITEGKSAPKWFYFQVPKAYKWPT